MSQNLSAEDLALVAALDRAEQQRALGIEGLCLVERFLSLEEESALLSSIDKQEWNTKLARRTQHYGYVYDYGAKSAAEETTPIPAWCEFVMDRLVDQNLLHARPDQMIVNEYEPGQGIFPHVDDVRSFADGIVSISLGSAVVMDFIRACEASQKKEVLLSRRSAIALHGPARYEWKHGIAARKSDHGIKRGRRVSLTFRTMNQGQRERKRAKTEV